MKTESEVLEQTAKELYVTASSEFEYLSWDDLSEIIKAFWLDEARKLRGLEIHKHTLEMFKGAKT